MVGRRHLRTRVYGIAIVYAAMLLAITALITIRARQTQQRYDILIDDEMGTVSRINDLVANQNSYRQLWRRALDEGGDVSQLPGRYLSVTQLMDRKLKLPDDEREQLAADARAIEGDLQALAVDWNAMPAPRRDDAWRRVEARMSALRQHAKAVGARKEREIAAERPQLKRDANSVMLLALGIAWIVGVGSFTVAQIAVRKIVRPIENLARAAEGIANNDFSIRAPVAGDHEIAELGVAFNRMAGSLAEYDEKLRNRARTDELTSLPNFRAFRERIDAEIERSNRYVQTFGILVLDLDHFKRYNDTWGHLAGNEALRAVAKAVHSTLRTVDFAARYGGEEFAVIVPETDIEGLRALAERIRVAIERNPPIEGRSIVTVSIGGALFPTDGSEAEPLFAAADARLYDAKKSGRNRVFVAPRFSSEASA
jgi:diguanylate cyclase (GGDEF)-like protein